MHASVRPFFLPSFLPSVHPPMRPYIHASICLYCAPSLSLSLSLSLDHLLSSTHVVGRTNPSSDLSIKHQSGPLRRAPEAVLRGLPSLQQGRVTDNTPGKPREPPADLGKLVICWSPAGTTRAGGARKKQRGAGGVTRQFGRGCTFYVYLLYPQTVCLSVSWVLRASMLHIPCV